MHINKDDWDYETLYEKRKDLVRILEDFFGDKISNIMIEPLDPDYPDTKVGIKYSCILYKKFYVEFYALRGFGFAIMQTEKIGISLSNIIGFEKTNSIPSNFKKETIELVLLNLDTHLKLQLPDKYLQHYGWL